MRRRLTLTIVGVVTGALLFAGVGSLVLVRRATINETTDDLALQVRNLAQTDESTGLRTPAALRALQRGLQLNDAVLARYLPRTRTWTGLPAGVSNADLAALPESPSTTGRNGSLVYAAETVAAPRGPVAAVVLTRRVPGSTGLGTFIAAGAVALAIAAFVGDRLGRRIARPLVEAEAATRRIATGDLDARVPTSAAADAELASLAESINSMAENLARLRGLERQFLLSVSHDLRTPLTSIRGFAEAIADGATDDTVRAAGVIAAEARRLERLVGDLLDLARLDARQFALDLQQVDVGVVVTATSDGFRPAAQEAGVNLSVAADDDDARATADPERLAQVVANLLENALAFATTRIDVAIERGARDVMISVTDDGPGIAPEEQARVFDRLYQPPRPGGVQPRRVGSGLGLAIVAELVTAMHGTVRAVAAPDGGTRVIVTLTAAS